MTFEKTTDNYSMYLIRVHEGEQKSGIRNEINAIGKQISGIPRSISILMMTVIGLLIIFFYFRTARTSVPVPKYRNQTTQPVDVLRDDSVPSAIVMSAPRKPALTATDSVKINSEIPQAPTQDNNSATDQAGEKPEQLNQMPQAEKKPVAQLLLKLTTDDSCTLKITNLDLDEVINWDLSPNDDGTIYLKQGRYSIVATSVISSTKTKTYFFDVKPGYARAKQNLHIRF
jgi:hypothetical protein